MNDAHSTGYFSLSSGTRQGDPISAYLFILIMEILFVQIRSNENILNFSGMNLSFQHLLMMFHIFLKT